MILQSTSLSNTYWSAKDTMVTKRLRTKSLTAYERRGDVGEKIFEMDVVPELIGKRGRDEVNREFSVTDCACFSSIFFGGALLMFSNGVLAHIRSTKAILTPSPS